jgi:hypothetical protein
MRVEEDNRTWQRVSKGVFVCVRDRYPAFGYIIEQQRDGRWLVRTPDGDVVRHAASGNVRSFRTAEVAAMNAASDGYDARYERVKPRRGAL